MNIAETPFEFFTVSYLTRIGNQSAGTLNEFLTGPANNAAMPPSFITRFKH